ASAPADLGRHPRAHGARRPGQLQLARARCRRGRAGARARERASRPAARGIRHLHDRRRDTRGPARRHLVHPRRRSALGRRRPGGRAHRRGLLARPRRLGCDRVGGAPPRPLAVGEPTMTDRFSDPGWWPTPPPKPLQAPSAAKLVFGTILPAVAVVGAVVVLSTIGHSGHKLKSMGAGSGFRGGRFGGGGPSKSFRTAFEVCRSLLATHRPAPAAPAPTRTTSVPVA